MEKRRGHHHSGHFRYSYPVSLGQRFYSAVLAPLVVLLVMFWALSYLHLPTSFQTISGSYLGGALAETLARLFVAYILALLLSFPLALAADASPWAEKILLPVFDIVQSVPVLAFFPVVIALFLRLGFTNGASVFIVFLSMLWNMVFSLIGGLKVIPEDIKSAARVFGIKGWSYLKRILLPATVPYLVTGSLLAWAQGWNIIIVAEVLHTYIPGGTAAQDPFGIGSVLVNAASSGQNGLFLYAIIAMIAAIAILNFFVWQRLLHYAERYKFE